MQFSLAVFLFAFFPLFLLAEEKCEIEVSASVSPSFGFYSSDDEPVSAQFLSGVKANKFCTLPLSITYPGSTEKQVRSHSDSFTKTFPVSGHFTLHDLSVSASDSCGFYNGVSVSTCSIVEWNVSPEAVAAARSGPVCADSVSPYTLREKKVIPKATAAFTATQQNTDRLPAPTLAHIVPGSLKIVPDESYVARTKRERHFTPASPYSPLDSFAVEFKLKYCVFPGEIFYGQLKTTDTSGTEIHVGGIFDLFKHGRFQLVKTEAHTATYRGAFEFNQAPERMEALVESIAAGREVTAFVFDNNYDTTPPQRLPVPMTNCARLWGSGRHTLVFSRLDYLNKYPLSVFINDAESVRTHGFEKIDPFRQPQYKESFSHFADLRLYDPTEWNKATDTLLDDDLAYGKKRLTLRVYNNVFKNIAGAGASCQSDSGAITAALGASPEPGFAALSGRGLFVDKDVEEVIKDYELFPSPLPIVVLHEFGHAFAGLNDEYVHRNGPEDELRFGMPFRNCSIVPRTAWQLNGIRYGDTKYSGCTFPEVFRGGTRASPNTVPVYRPSDKSMMKAAQSGEWRFNVVSCGYIVAAIKGGQAKDYWPECMRYDTVKPTETAAAPFGRFLSWFAPGALPAGEHLVAQVGSPVTGGQQSPPYLIIESFDPHNPWGEIVEVVPDDYVEPVTPITPPSLSLNLTASAPVVTGGSAGAEDRLYTGEMTLRAAITNEGEEIQQTFGNTIQYRDVSVSGAWVDWITFEVSGLIAGGRATVEHTWGGGVGEWEFRLVADSGNVVTESDEQDNYSEPARVSIVAREGEIAPPSASGGAPKLLLSTPVISGQQAGLGKVVAGSMKISAKVTNIGNGIAPPFKLLLFSSRNGRDWSAWTRLDFLRLAPNAEREVVYTWRGRTGQWYFKVCEDSANTCSSASVVEVVPVGRSKYELL